jgi:potassium efflux system protein
MGFPQRRILWTLGGSSQSQSTEALGCVCRSHSSSFGLQRCPVHAVVHCWLEIRFRCQSTAGKFLPINAAPNNVAPINVAPAQDAEATPTIPLPTPESIQEQLTKLPTSTEIAEETKPLLGESLQRLLDALKQTAEIKTRRNKIEDQIAAIPQELKKVRFELEQAPPSLKPIESSQPLEEVRGRKVVRDSELALAKSLRAELQAKTDNRKTRRTQAADLIAGLRTELQKLETDAVPAASPTEVDPRLVESQRLERVAAIELVKERLAFQLQDQRAIEAEEELLPLQLQLAQRTVTRLEEEVALLGDAISSRREIKVENALRIHSESLLAQHLSPDDSIVLKLGPLWTDLVKKHGETEREKAAAAAQAEQLTQELSGTREEIRKDLAGDGTLRSGLGMKLQRQRGKLPTLNELNAQLKSVDSRIEEMGAFQAQLEVMIDELSGRGVKGSRPVLLGNDPAIQREVDRLSEIDRDIDNYTNDLIELKDHLGQIRTTTLDFLREIDSNVLWIRNSRPYSTSDLTTAWGSFQWVMAPENMKTLAKATFEESKLRPDIVVLWMFITGLLIGLGSRLRRAIRELGEKAAKRNQTAMRPTLRVLWMSVILSLPIASLLAFPGWLLAEYSGESLYVQAVGASLLLMAMVVLPLEFARQLVRRNGLAVLHFGFREEHASLARGTLRFVIDLGMPIALIWGIAYNCGNASINSSLARPMFFCGMSLMSFAFWRIAHPSNGIMADIVEKKAGGWLDRLRYVWHPAISAIPLFLGVLSLAGYSYSARQLAEQLYWTLWLVLALLVVGGVLRRWVTLSRRHLLLAQARQRASDAERREGVPIEVILENPGPDVSEINAQTLRLINAFLTVMTIVGLAYMWAPVLPAVRFLDAVTLWGSGALDDEGREIPVTLGSLLTSLPIILLTFVSVRNVPGLLESVLLQKLPLENAARYAITTLSSYAMLMIGIVVSANTLGLNWASIQWLVAALGVGLGFGLQEIFANFISGIILLFEQPIRVGDVVTIDGTTGAVSRIRMRATTVTNWDRQELIIPNKDLITGRLINWTLSDSTNRIVINVGIAYGSNTRTACELLENICKEHPNVCDDPVPIVSFESFGESTLNLVVRCFLKTLDVRVRTVHELHTLINERFSEAGLEIAFPQRDLHIRSFPAGFQAIVKDGDR